MISLKDNLNPMVQAKAYMKYSQENIAYTLGFLGLCNIFIPMLTKKLIMTLFENSKFLAIPSFCFVCHFVQ
jgi:hypothetical protein